MTQLNIQVTGVGWGSLKADVDEVKNLHTKVGEIQRLLLDQQAHLDLLIQELNGNRRRRVLDLLKADGLAICLLHRFLFRESKPSQWLAPEGGIILSRMHRSWREYHREYDSDTEVFVRAGQYDSTLCTICEGIVYPGSFTDSKGVTHSRMLTVSPEVKSREGLYTVEILDAVSTDCYGMPVVNGISLESL